MVGLYKRASEIGALPLVHTLTRWAARSRWKHVAPQTRRFRRLRTSACQPAKTRFVSVTGTGQALDEGPRSESRQFAADFSARASRSGERTLAHAVVPLRAITAPSSGGVPVRPRTDASRRGHP